MHSFSGKTHTFHFNGDFSGDILMSHPEVDEDGYAHINGEDFHTMAKIMIGGDLISVIEKYMDS